MIAALVAILVRIRRKRELERELESEGGGKGVPDWPSHPGVPGVRGGDPPAGCGGGFYTPPMA